ncbi:hypothetical protein DSECCO2_388220 [anaerobic digester metagenome]
MVRIRRFKGFGKTERRHLAQGEPGQNIRLDSLIFRQSGAEQTAQINQLSRHPVGIRRSFAQNRFAKAWKLCLQKILLGLIQFEIQFTNHAGLLAALPGK